MKRYKVYLNAQCLFSSDDKTECFRFRWNYLEKHYYNSDKYETSIVDSETNKIIA